MSLNQYDWGTLDPDAEDGTELAAALNAWVAAVLSMHRGTGAPSYVAAGMIWPKSVSGTVEQIYYNDGGADILLATVNPTAHTVQYPATALPAATTAAQGAAELLTPTEQLTGIDAGRAATADSVAALWEDGGQINASGVISLGEGGSFELITSTANITGFTFATAKTGRRATVRFSTARTLVNSSNLILPGGASILTAIGDLAEVEDRGGGVSRLKYYRADGTSLVAAVSFASDEIVGGVLSNFTSTTIDVAACSCWDSTKTSVITFAGGTINFATTGANGLRTGSLTVGAKGGLFLISGTSGVALFADTSLTPGTRPAGYTAAWRRIGTWFADASSHLVPLIQTGRRYRRTTLTTDIGSGAGQPITLTRVNLALALPTGKKWPVMVRTVLSTSVNGICQLDLADPDSASQTPTLTDAPLTQNYNDVGASGRRSISTVFAVTNIASELAAKIDQSNAVIWIHLVYWEDDGL